MGFRRNLGTIETNRGVRDRTQLRWEVRLGQLSGPSDLLHVQKNSLDVTLTFPISFQNSETCTSGWDRDLASPTRQSCGGESIPQR